MTSGLLGAFVAVAVFAAGAWLSYLITGLHAAVRRDADLARQAARHESELVAADGQTDRMSDALYNLIGAVTTPSRDMADLLDAATAGGYAALDGYGYTGQLVSLKAALVEAESDATTYCMALVEMLDAIDEERFGDLDGIRQLVADRHSGTEPQATS